MRFVCESCKTAGKLIGVDLTPIAPLQRELHAQCKGGTWCDCQHREQKR